MQSRQKKKSYSEDDLWTYGSKYSLAIRKWNRKWICVFFRRATRNNPKNCCRISLLQIVALTFAFIDRRLQFTLWQKKHTKNSFNLSSVKLDIFHIFRSFSHTPLAFANCTCFERTARKKCPLTANDSNRCHAVLAATSPKLSYEIAFWMRVNNSKKHC